MVPLNNDPGYWQQGTFKNPTNISDDILCSETDGNQEGYIEELSTCFYFDTVLLKSSESVLSET